jgi:signal transduction histidine kinase/multisubunit Na+/H+ antiporter MnhG subunit
MGKFEHKGLVFSFFFLTSLVTILQGFYSNWPLPGYLYFSLIFICIGSFLLATYLALKEQIKSRLLLIVLVFTFLVASIVWYRIDYISYYNDVAYQKSFEASEFLKIAKTVLSQDTSEKIKEKELKRLFEVSKAKVIISKKSKALKTKENGINNSVVKILNLPDRRGSDYLPHTYYDQEEITVGDNTYYYTYIYSNRPKKMLSFIRATTFSIYPDVLINGATWNDFIKKHDYERSEAFWGSFIALWTVITLLLMHSAQRRLESERRRLAEIQQRMAEEKQAFAEAKQKELEKEIEKTKAFRAAYLKILEEVKKESSDFAKQEIFAKLNAFENCSLAKEMDTIAHSEKHDLDNEIVSLVEHSSIKERKAYNSFFSKIIKTIYTRLDHLQERFDLTSQRLKLSQVTVAIKDCCTRKSKFLSNSINLTYKDLIAEKEKDLTININLFRLQSVIDNLLMNSLEAIQLHDSKLDRKERKEFVGRIKVLVEYVFEKNQLKITIADNGGGFSEKIMEQIYKKSVTSSKRKGRIGRGTGYIKFYVVDLLGGEVVASNYNDGVSKGAKTEIYLDCNS